MPAEVAAGGVMLGFKNGKPRVGTGAPCRLSGFIKTMVSTPCQRRRSLLWHFGRGVTCDFYSVSLVTSHFRAFKNPAFLWVLDVLPPSSLPLALRPSLPSHPNTTKP